MDRELSSFLHRDPTSYLGGYACCRGLIECAAGWSWDLSASPREVGYQVISRACD